ncbi:MAG: hypothetical protein ACHQ17_08445 [Polyangia bacterium]|jgi:ribosomal protein L37E
MEPNERCPHCGQQTATDAADVCSACGHPIDWRSPHTAEVIDNNDEKVIENTRSVKPPSR